MEISFRGRYTPVHLLRGTILLSRGSAFWYFVRLAALFVVVVFFVIVAVDVFRSPEVSSARWVRLLRAAIPFAIAVYALGKPLWAILQLYLEFGSKGERSGIVDGEICSTGVRFFYTDTFGIEIPWEKFYRKRITNDLMALDSLGGLPVILPRSFFKSEADWQSARNWVQNKVIEAKG